MTPKVGKLTARFPSRCAACQGRIAKGQTIWYWRAADPGSKTRCLSCGPHPGAPLPTFNRRTDAELGRTQVEHERREALEEHAEHEGERGSNGLPLPDADQLREQLQGSIEREHAHGKGPQGHGATETGSEHESDNESESNASGVASALAVLLAQGRSDKVLAKRVSKLENEALVVQEQIKAISANAPVTRTLEIRRPDAEPKRIEGAHVQLETVLGRINAGFKNVFLVGPMGTGKSTIAKHAADGLSMRYGQLSGSSGVTEAHLFGRVLPQKDGSWAHQPTLFLEIYEQGGLFCLDELDSFEANLLIALNSALDNGRLTNPVTGAVHERHADSVIVCTANTFGLGADAVYCGRNQLDGATLDRFLGATIYIDYDQALERSIAHAVLNGTGKGLVDWVHTVRNKAVRNKLRRGVSMRMVVAGAKLMASGMSLDQVQRELLVSWSEDERRKVL